VAKFGLVDLAKDLGVEVIMLDHGLDWSSWRGTRSLVEPIALGWPEGRSQALVAPSPSNTTSRSCVFRPGRETTSHWTSD